MDILKNQVAAQLKWVWLVADWNPVDLKVQISMLSCGTDLALHE